MPARYRRSSPRVRGMRRKHIWATSNVTSSVVTATGITPVDLLAGLETGGVGIVGGTIVRSHVMLSISDPAADTNPGVFWGLVVYGKDRVGANVPPVLTDSYLDWLMIRELTPGCAPTSWQNSAFTDYLYGGEFDVKAKRRLPQMDDSLFICLYNGGSSTISYTWFIRTLIALP
jgi:hypothetical protein